MAKVAEVQLRNILKKGKLGIWSEKIPSYNGMEFKPNGHIIAVILSGSAYEAKTQNPPQLSLTHMAIC